MKFTKLLLVLLFSSLLISEDCTDSNSQPIKIYPNPVKDNFELSFVLDEESNVNIQIFDINGIMVLEPIHNTIYNSGEVKIAISTRELSKGVYLCRISAGEFSKTEKFVKSE